MSNTADLEAMWREIRMVYDSPARDFNDNLNTLFEGFYSLFENIVDKLDDLENTIFQLQETVVAQQKDIEQLQSIVLTS